MVNPATSEPQWRRWDRENPERRREITFKYRHGITFADHAAILSAQGGRCYLCGDELSLEKSIIEHDHRCCQKPRSCAVCRRGLACQPCNVVIGLAMDDPERLRRIADNLEIAKELVGDRLVAAPQQLALDD